MRGLEPPRGFPHTDLNRARLPIPPHPRELGGAKCSGGLATDQVTGLVTLTDLSRPGEQREL